MLVVQEKRHQQKDTQREVRQLSQLADGTGGSTSATCKQEPLLKSGKLPL